MKNFFPSRVGCQAVETHVSDAAEEHRLAFCVRTMVMPPSFVRVLLRRAAVKTMKVDHAIVIDTRPFTIEERGLWWPWRPSPSSNLPLSSPFSFSSFSDICY
jgi:hypothetical protein